MAEAGRDLVLAPNEFAYISDETKGIINCYVGPYKASLSQTDKPVIFNDQKKRFIRCELSDAVRTFAIAPEGWYIQLKNPSSVDAKAHPKAQSVSDLPELNIGRKVNIPGPAAFALWPGQMSRVLKGHHLRSNQYLMVRVYDDQAAKANWSRAVIKKQATEGDEKEEAELATPIELTMGQLLIIKGTEVAFYIPPTGIEVVPEGDKYVRDAVTLERLEYCILLDEDGNKRFIQGPDVVFPEPTETFVQRNSTRKFKAIELNEISGLYVKVIADYEEGGERYKVGDELFITGKDQMIYFPREEHALVKYGDQEIHYAVAIPAGEARYVLDRIAGTITLKRGPAMFLPDPRKEVIVRRVLTPTQVQLYYPGNSEALNYNIQLAAVAPPGGRGYVPDRNVRDTKGGTKRGFFTDNAAYGGPDVMAFAATTMTATEAASNAFGGDALDRKTSYTPPRSITIDTKYEGVPSIDVWTGYAILVTSKTGKREVIVGPKTVLLEYDETLEVMELSTGKPKNTDNLLKDVYLRYLNNKVGDIINEVETKDLCSVDIKLSYRVDFEGDPNKWFNCENYVKFMCDHLRSIIRGTVKKYGIEEFYSNYTAILRDALLGIPSDQTKRPGRNFEENGMKLKDVEVLKVTISDRAVSSILVDAQRESVHQAIEVNQQEENLKLTQRREAVKRQEASEYDTTNAQIIELESLKLARGLEFDIKRAAASFEVDEAKKKSAKALQALDDEMSRSRLALEKFLEDQKLELEGQRLQQFKDKLAAEVEAAVQRIKAVTPDLIAALQAFGDKSLLGDFADALAPLAITGDESTMEMISKITRGLPLSKLISQLTGSTAPVAELTSK